MLIAFVLGFAFTVILCVIVVVLLLKLGLLRNQGDVTNRFEAHRELVSGTLDLMRERAETRMNDLEKRLEMLLKSELDPLRKDLEDARAGVLNLAHRLDKQEDKLESVATGNGLPGEGRTVPTDMEVVGGGAIGND